MKMERLCFSESLLLQSDENVSVHLTITVQKHSKTQHFKQFQSPTTMSMALLDDVFADGIISKTIWPPRSPDISLPDFFLWGAIKNSGYSNSPHTTDELKMAVTEYIRNVDRAILNTVFESTVRHVNECLETGGGHFEYYL